MLRAVLLLAALALTASGCAKPSVNAAPFSAAPQTAACPTCQPSVACATPTPAASFGAGVKMVGTNIQAGTYQASNVKDCYWARLSGFGGTLREIIANGNADGTAVVTIDPADKGFESSRCGTWTLVP